VTSLVSGTACPTLQFKIGTYLFNTDAATTYEGGSCTSIKAGTKITVTATRVVLKCRVHDFMGQNACKFCRVQRLDKFRIVEKGDAIGGHSLNRARGPSTQTKEQ